MRTTTVGERYVSRIADAPQAEAAMAATALAFYALAALQSALGALMNRGDRSIAIDAVLIVFLAWNMRRHRSRTYSLGLLVAALLALGSTFATRMGYLQGGANVFLAVLSVYLGARALYATIVYHRRLGDRTRLDVAALKNLASLVLFGLFGLAVGAADRAGLVIGPGQPTLLSLILLLSVVVYSLPFAPWFPWLGRRSLMKPKAPAVT
jgi:hypothetical protein